MNANFHGKLAADHLFVYWDAPKLEKNFN